MKKKLSIIIPVAILLIALSGIICVKVMNSDDERMITKLFGLTETKYEIVSVSNTLQTFKYDGHYTVVVRVSEEDMDTFISEVERKFKKMDEKTKFYFDTYIRNSFGVEVNEEHVFYIYMGPVMRPAIALTQPKTAGGGILFGKPVDGVYEIGISYSE